MKKITKIMLILLVFLISFGAGIGSNFLFPHGVFYHDPLSVDWDESVGSIQKDLRYGEAELNTYDLALPADDSKQSYGLVVTIHGGGYMNGDKSGDEPYLKYFTSKGYVTASINYTLDTEETESNITLISQEVKSSIPVIIEAAKKQGYNIKEMALIGGSAGAHLAMVYAYGSAESSPVPVKFVVNMVGPTSLEPDAWYGFGEIVHTRSKVKPEGEITNHSTVDYSSDADLAQKGADYLTSITGQKVTTEMMADGGYQEVLKPISPYLLVNKSSVPTIVAYAPKDIVLPSSMKDYLLTVLDENKVTYKYIEFPKSGHGLQNDPKEWTQLFEAVDQYLAKFMSVS